MLLLKSSVLLEGRAVFQVLSSYSRHPVFNPTVNISFGANVKYVDGMAHGQRVVKEKHNY